MRMLFGFVALVSVVLVPWSSLAPALLPNASGSAITPGSSPRKALAVRLSPSLGLLPLAPNEDLESGSTVAHAHETPAGSKSPRVVCENGVCRLVTDAETDLPRDLSPENSKIESIRTRLEGIGATQVRVTRDPTGESRCSCSVPLSDGSKVMRRFEVTGNSDDEAVAGLVKSVETWMHNRQ